GVPDRCGWPGRRRGSRAAAIGARPRATWTRRNHSRSTEGEDWRKGEDEDWRKGGGKERRRRSGGGEEEGGRQEEERRKGGRLLHDLPRGSIPPACRV